MRHRMRVRREEEEDVVGRTCLRLTPAVVSAGRWVGGEPKREAGWRRRLDPGLGRR